jgi:hypothetical protein
VDRYNDEMTSVGAQLEPNMLFRVSHSDDSRMTLGISGKTSRVVSLSHPCTPPLSRKENIHKGRSSMTPSLRPDGRYIKCYYSVDILKQHW